MTIFSTRKGHSPSLANALWTSPFVSCPAPCGESDHHYLIFGGFLFEKESPKSYSKGLRAGFSCRFEVYRTAIKIRLLLSAKKVLAKNRKRGNFR